MNIKGTGTVKDISGKSHVVIGAGTFADNETFRKLEVAGSLSFEKISCDKINVAGKCEGDFLSAQVLKISGSCEIDSVAIEQTLEISGKPLIDCVTADEIFIASHSGFLGSVKCRRIKIFDETNFAVSRRIRVRIKNIEADVVDLENCEVEIIHCNDAFIGSNCAVEKLFVSGECKVADDSTVGDTIHT